MKYAIDKKKKQKNNGNQNDTKVKEVNWMIYPKQNTINLVEFVLFTLK